MLLSVHIGRGQSQEPADSSGTQALVALLEKSGYNYSKVDEGTYQVGATGKNLKEFDVNVLLSGDVVLVMARLADRKELSKKSDFLTKLLELNHHFDSVKLAYTEDMLYARIDNHLRIMDVQELKYMIDQVANVTDETYPQIQKEKPSGR